MDQDDFELLNEELQPFQVGNRTKGASLLAWFLTHVWRMAESEVESAICDGHGDKGIDALLINDDLLEITILQGKHRQGAKTTQGDSDLKALAGAAAYFKTLDTFDALIQSKPNKELLRLLARNEVREKLQSGSYSVRLAFVTNAELDDAGRDYATVSEAAGQLIDIWDRRRCVEVAKRTRRPALRSEKIELPVMTATSRVALTKSEFLVVALVKAKELVKLPGITDLSLFSRNVRLSVGKTRVNRELDKTLVKPQEHALFAAYHNGMTLLTEGLAVASDTLTLNGVGVVNGCQSLLALHGAQKALTDDLLVTVKVVEVVTDNDVADRITYRSNNQNAVSMRDQRSTEPVMQDLQAQARQRFGDQFALSIRVGETLNASDVLDNSLAAQLIVAAYLKEPWAAVRKVRLFDDDFRRIFSRSIDADKLYLLYLVDQAILKQRDSLNEELQSSFASIRFTLNFLVCEVLRLSIQGRALLDAPGSWLPNKLAGVAAKLESIAADVIESVNYHVSEMREEDDLYDAKSAFKSRTGVSKLQQDALSHSKRQAKRDASYLFDLDPA